MERGKTIKKVLCISVMCLALAAVVVPQLPMQDNATKVEAATKKVKLSTTRTYLIKGKTKKLKLTNAKGKIKWTSNKKSIATVSSKGVVRGRKAGTAIITAKYNNKSYRCRVIVESPKMSKSKVTLQKGKTVKLTLKNTKQKVTWSTSNRKIATVTSKGLVKGVKTGKATIYAKVGTNRYKCVVTVKSSSSGVGTQPEPQIEVQSVTLNTNSVELNVGQSYMLVANVLPSSATNKTLNWKSSNTDIVEVSYFNGQVIAKAPGQATITVTSSNGKQATCTVIVKNALEQSYAKLKNYILQSPKVNSDGNHFISFTDSQYGQTGTFGIVYEHQNDRFSFVNTTEVPSSNVETSATMWINALKSGTTEPEIICIYNNYYSAFVAKSTLQIGTYNESDLTFYKTQSTGVFTTNAVDIQDLCNSTLRLAFAGWEKLLEDQVGMHLSDLGFNAYK